MSCMEHFCHECKHVWFNNEPRPMCPLCCSHNVAHTFDEDGDHDEPEEEDDE
jgi:hypothetical protein